MKLKRITGMCRKEKCEAETVRGCKFILVLKYPVMKEHVPRQTGVNHASEPPGLKKKIKNKEIYKY
jgi:hypothetical protein